MPYSSTYPYSRPLYSNSTGRNMTRRWRASQRRTSYPLSLFDPCLQMIYKSALEHQGRSPNIVCCNPFTKEAEEVPYPLTVSRNLLVSPNGLALYLRERRLGWCCWCSLATGKPQFAILIRDVLGPFLECFECGFYVPLNKVYETATEFVLYPHIDSHSALQPITKSAGVTTQGGKQGIVRSGEVRKIKKAHGRRCLVEYKKESSPDFPSAEELIDEFKAGSSRSIKKKRHGRHASKSKKGTENIPMEIYEEKSELNPCDGDQDMHFEEEYASTIVIDSD